MIKIAFIILTLLIWPISSAAETIKVLIIDESFPKTAKKDEVLQKMGERPGYLLSNGSQYIGNIEVWRGEKGLYVVNELPMEEYVKSVVSAEVGTNWDMEALKAQAVIVRTYALYHKQKATSPIYHLTSSVLHQIYKGNSFDSNIEHAVMETEGKILTYNNKPIEALYHSTCGGKTEDAANVFGISPPYLKPVESKCEMSPLWVWERKIPLSEIEKALNISDIKNISINSYTSTGRVKELTLLSNPETMIIKATELRKALGWSRLPSTNFSISLDGNDVIFDGNGYGHGVGLCQWSALEMAREGKNYKEILSFFYPGTTIQIYESRRF